MPALSRWMVRLAFVYLLFGGLLGGWMLISRGFPDLAWSWRWYLNHVEWMQMGWLLNLVFGVAYWIFPKFEGGKRPYKALAYLACVLLNTGILVYSLQVFFPGTALFRLVGRSLEGLAMCAFLGHLFPRIKPFAATLRTK